MGPKGLSYRDIEMFLELVIRHETSAFQNCWAGRNGLAQRTPRSPDLTSSDFYPRAFKTKVHCTVLYKD
jgi:hypothetical protein